MDLDHVNGEKVKAISKLVAEGYVLEVIKAEVEKCELVCSNCHRDRTFKRKQQAHGARTPYTDLASALS